MSITTTFTTTKNIREHIAPKIIGCKLHIRWNNSRITKLYTIEWGVTEELKWGDEWNCDETEIPTNF